MRIFLTRALLAGIGLPASLMVVHAEAPALRPGVQIAAGGSPLNPGAQLIPCVADWNGDGLADLLCGFQPWTGNVAVYLNRGTASEPVFSSSTNVQAGGADISHPSSGCGSAAPWVGDYDGDGLIDLLVGSGADGKVYFYKNTGTAGAIPVLASGVGLLANGSPLSVGSRATPFLHDWDEDGLVDLMCGDGSGQVHYFRNVGTAGAPVYQNDVLLTAGGATVNFGFRSAARVVDWDGDGLKDLVGSGSSYAGWCRNIGTNANPQLEARVPLQAPVAGTGLANIDNGYRMRLEVVDWNLDGVLDLLIGSSDGFLWHYEGYRLACTGISIPAPGTVQLEWRSAPYLSYRILGGDSPEAVVDPVDAGVVSQGDTTTWSGSSSARFFKVVIE